MRTINSSLAYAVNGYAPRNPRNPHHHCGLMPPKNPALRAFIGAELCRRGLFGIHNLSCAAAVMDVSRAMLRAAKALLDAQDDARVERVLSGAESLLRVAREIRKPAPSVLRIADMRFDHAIAS